MRVIVEDNSIHFYYSEDGKNIKESFDLDFFIKKVLNNQIFSNGK